jgi:hypothetical protein
MTAPRPHVPWSPSPTILPRREDRPDLWRLPPIGVPCDQPHRAPIYALITLTQDAAAVQQSNVVSAQIVLNGVAAGALLLLFATTFNEAGAGGGGVGDSVGGTTWQLAQTGGDFNTLGRLHIWYAFNVPSGNHTVTFTPADQADVSLSMTEWAGIATTAPLDANPAQGANGGPDTAPTSVATGVLAQADELVVSGGLHGGGAITVTKGNIIAIAATAKLNGFDSGATAMPIFSEYRVVSATTSGTGTFTLSVSNGWRMGILSFKAAAGAAVIDTISSIVRASPMRLAPAAVRSGALFRQGSTDGPATVIQLVHGNTDTVRRYAWIAPHGRLIQLAPNDGPPTVITLLQGFTDFALHPAKPSWTGHVVNWLPPDAAIAAALPDQWTTFIRPAKPGRVGRVVNIDPSDGPPTVITLVEGFTDFVARPAIQSRHGRVLNAEQSDGPATIILLLEGATFVLRPAPTQKFARVVTSADIAEALVAAGVEQFDTVSRPPRAQMRGRTMAGDAADIVAAIAPTTGWESDFTGRLPYRGPRGIRLMLTQTVPWDGNAPTPPPPTAPVLVYLKESGRFAIRLHIGGKVYEEIV